MSGKQKDLNEIGFMELYKNTTCNILSYCQKGLWKCPSWVDEKLELKDWQEKWLDKKKVEENYTGERKYEYDIKKKEKCK